MAQATKDACGAQRTGKPTEKNVAKAIEAMRAALVEEYGADYSFTVHGHGALLAASNKTDGVVLSRVER